jgi:5'-methylthioadenosine phosphorylase
MNDRIEIGIIGGSGLYKMEGLKDARTVSLETPFGAPSDAYLLGILEGKRIAFLPRHSRRHRISPSEINYRANIYGFKQLGVEHIIGLTAVGSLKTDIRPLDIVIPDQFFDRTRKRMSTFFGEGLTAHIAFADPVCPILADLVYHSADQVAERVHGGGILLCVDGPAFSTRAESNIYRKWGIDILGMTTIQEAKLAREAEICYAALALVTDYDCWHEEEAAVTAETVVQNLQKNLSIAQDIIRMVVPKISYQRDCICSKALKNAMMTDAAAIPPQTRSKLELLVGKYFDK